MSRAIFYTTEIKCVSPIEGLIIFKTVFKRPLIELAPPASTSLPLSKFNFRYR